MSQDAAKIFDAGLDPAEFHEAERALNLLTEQMQEFKEAAVNLVTPTTTSAMKTLFNVFREGTEFLTENNKALRSWIDTFAKAAVDAAGLRPLLAHFSDNDDTQKLDDHTKKVLQTQDDLNKAYAKQKIQMQGDPTTQYGWQRLNDLRDELRELEIELDNFGNSYDETLAKVDLWREKSLRQNDLSKQERIAIEELYAAKVEQIEQEKEDRLDEIREKANSKFKTDLQNQLDAIEKQKDDWISVGMDEAEAETLAQREKADAISKLNAEVAKNLDSIWQSSLEKRLSEIDREKQAWIQKGVEEVKVTQWAEQAKADAQRAVASSIANSQDQANEYDAFQKGGYQGLKKYKANKELADLLKKAPSGENVTPEQCNNFVEEVRNWQKRQNVRNATPEDLENFKRAQELADKSMFPNLMTERDKIDEERLRLQSQIVEQERRRAEAEKMAAGITDANGNSVINPEQISDIFGVVPNEELERMKQRLEELNNATENYKNQIDQPAENEEPENNIDAPFEDLSSKIENVNSNFDDLTPTIENISSNFDDISATIENLSSEFDNLTATLENINGNFENLAAVLENIGQSEEKTPQLPQTENPATPLNINDLISVFDVMKPTLENVNSYFDALTPQIENASNYFGGLSENALSATEAFSHLAEKINALDLSLKSSPEITNNVTINEAHAWDYSHIMELAERVADVLTPRILGALGGGLNNY